MKFSTSCFVRVENPQERKELTEWLESIGYALMNPYSNHGFVVESDAMTGMYYRLESIIRHDGFTELRQDCGTNILLFKALAAMNDENDQEQILTDGSRYIVCHLDNFHEYPQVNVCIGDDGEHNIFEIVKTENWRKATAEEIINHFKNKRHE